MHRNWKEICAESNTLLRLLVSTTGDERILEGLRRGFPQFFSEEPSEHPVPLSAIASMRFGDEFDDEPPLPERVLDHFGIPYFLLQKDKGISYPDEWDSVLAGSNFDINDSNGLPEPRTYLEWHGARCLVVEHVSGTSVILVPEGRIDLSR